MTKNIYNVVWVIWHCGNSIHLSLQHRSKLDPVASVVILKLFMLESETSVYMVTTIHASNIIYTSLQYQAA